MDLSKFPDPIKRYVSKEIFKLQLAQYIVAHQRWYYNIGDFILPGVRIWKDFYLRWLRKNLLGIRVYMWDDTFHISLKLVPRHPGATHSCATAYDKQAVMFWNVLMDVVAEQKLHVPLFWEI